MSTRSVLRFFWLIGGLALVLAALREFLVRPSPSVRLLDSRTTWIDGGFQPDGAYPSTTQGRLPGDIATAGSWINGDAWQGEAATPWVTALARHARIYVAGYPHHRGCRLWVEFRHVDGTITRLDCAIADPHETWVPWDFRPPADAAALRIVAEDHATDGGGWFAFSEPTLAPSTLWPSAYMAAQIIATFALALILVWLPGILWAPRGASPEIRLVFLLAAGPLGLAATGVLIWLFDGAVRPTLLASGFVTAWWLAIGVTLWRRNAYKDTLPPYAWRVVALAALVALSAVAKASYSAGPAGELFAGTHYRTLAVGDRSDARISFFVVQVAARHLGPASAESDRFFAPWTFFSRGPLAGLAAVPVSLAAAGLPPPNRELRAWQPFDETGYAAYRIVQITLASMVIFALFATLVPLIGDGWGFVAAGLLALCPFGVHEVLFTWPKWEATTWLLASFALAHQRRPFAAGLALGVGFLFHPMAALWAPWLMLWAAGRHGRDVRAFLGSASRYIAATALLVLPWMALGVLLPHLPTSENAGPGSFIRYFLIAAYQPATWQTWWQTRWENFSNTFLPFWLYLFHRDHSTLGDIYAPSGRLVKFAFGWWNTLPLGAGLGLWAVASIKLVSTARQPGIALLLFLAGPGLLLTAYWGAAPTGLMRECGHPLPVAVIALLCIASAAAPGKVSHLIAHPVIPWLQLPETLLMLWLATVLNPLPAGADFNLFDPFYLALSVLALVMAALILSRGRSVSR